MLESTYTYNLYLGCDIHALNENVNEPFKLLDRYDFALAHAPYQHKSQTAISQCFREWNCDVIFYKNSQQTKHFIREWKRLYENDLVDHAHDQGSFRHLMWENTAVNIFTLPYHYNNRCGMSGSQSSSPSDISESVIIQNRDVIRDLRK